MTLTMLSGNCKSMYSEIAGKILSEVKDTLEVYAATAKELNATSTDKVLVSSVTLQDPMMLLTWDTSPERRVQ